MLVIVRKICIAVLQIVAFIGLLTGAKAFFSPLFTELYMLTPFVFFCTAAGFFSLFLIRQAACLAFLPKARLKGILRDGEIAPSPSKYFSRVFGAPFLKRGFLYVFLFSVEALFRLLSIRLYLILTGYAVPFLERLANQSAVLPFLVSLAAGFLIMEFPFYEVFYKHAFANASNRLYEYRFGLKAFLYVLLLYVLSILVTYVYIRTGAVDMTSKTGSLAVLITLVPFGYALWAGMYIPNARRVLSEKLHTFFHPKNRVRKQ